jgi:phospholipid/cholesterol/gamma-HCH transport system substrate-binding protein
MAENSTLHRYASELVGTFVLVAVIVFVLALFAGGRVNEWLNPGLNVRIVMPAAGLFGLSEGASVQILGSKAGDVRRIVIQPDESIYADVHILDGMSDFVRRDSEVTIRKRFGVAGDSFLDITRGRGQPLDEQYAVLEARIDQAASASPSELLAELKDRALPVIEDAANTVHALAALTEGLSKADGNLQQTLANLNAVSGRIARGEGAVGRLLVEDALIRELETLVAGLNHTLGSIGPVMDDLQVTVRNVAVMSEAISAQSQSIPEVSRRMGSVLDSVDEIMKDLKRTTPELPRMTRNIADTTENLPMLLIQTQQTVSELELLIRQLRASWLVGGGAGEPSQPASRISPLEVTP